MSWWPALALMALAVTACGSATTSGSPEASTAHLSGVACGRSTVGKGVVVGDGLILTNAHVVAGVDAIQVSLPGSADVATGGVVGFDPEADLALVRVDGVDGPAAVLGEAAAGTRGTLVAVDEAAEVTRRPFEVLRRIRATGEDIYREPGANRRALEVSMEFERGLSGAGLFDAEGRLVGVAFAASRTRDDVAFAVAEAEIEAFLATASSEPTDAGPCL